MRSLYRKLFNISFFHEFYRNKEDKFTHLDEDFEILPTATCQQKLNDLGLLFRKTSGSITLLMSHYEEDGSEFPLKPLTAPIKLSFQVFAKNPFIKHYSELPIDGSENSLFYLSNRNNNPQVVDGDNTLILSKDTNSPYLSSFDRISLRASHSTYSFKKNGDQALLEIRDARNQQVFNETLNKLEDGSPGPMRNFATTLYLKNLPTGIYSLILDNVHQESFYLDDQILRRKPFGMIEMFHDPDVNEDYRFADTTGQALAKNFQIRINRRATVWKYLVGLKYRKDLDPTDLEVVSNQYVATFTQKASYTLADNTTVIPFDSGNTLIPLQKEPLKGFKLKRTIKGSGQGNSSTEEITLPNPQFQHLKTDNGTIYSEVYVYL